MKLQSSAADITVDRDDQDITSQFQHFLENAVKKMYPKPNSLNFVPPIYFNKTRYKKHKEGGQVFYVPCSSDMREVMQDKAMEHVLNCLRLVPMAEEEQEQMFVLTQFQYDDYLNNPGEKYEQHNLKTPCDENLDDKRVECFDFFIVHRKHGMLVGVVNSVSEISAESEDRQKEMGKIVFQEVQTAVQQLQKANRMIRHFMSDQKRFPRVRQTLVLPNLSRASLKDTVAQDNALVDVCSIFLRDSMFIKLICCYTYVNQ